MSAPLYGPRARYNYPATERGVERYWYIPASIVVLINLAGSPLIYPSWPLSPYDVFTSMLFIIIGFKALVMMIRKPAWPEGVIIMAVVSYLAGEVLSNISGINLIMIEVLTALNGLSWILLGIGYYGWGVKSSPGEKIASVPLAFQILVLAVGFGMLLCLLLAVVFYPLSFPGKGWGLVFNYQIAVFAVMVVASIFRAFRVGAWPDWLQFVGLGVLFVLNLTMTIISWQLISLNDFQRDDHLMDISEFASSLCLLLFAIGFFAARPARGASSAE
jgi:hypothetical protein